MTTDGWRPVSDIRWDDTHRLILASYAGSEEPILAGLVGDTSDVEDLVALSAATNARLRAQDDALPGGIHRDELVFAVPDWRIINAAFCYPHPQGSRFNRGDRGAWYAGREVATSMAEVAFHKSVELAEIDWWHLTVDYQDYLADVHAPLNDLRDPVDDRARTCLDPDSYLVSQTVGQMLLDSGSIGLAYPSVRDHGRDALACFRPAVLANVRPGRRYRMTWSGEPEPEITGL